MRLSFLAASIPTAFFAIACDGTIDDRVEPTLGHGFTKVPSEVLARPTTSRPALTAWKLRREDRNGGRLPVEHTPTPAPEPEPAPNDSCGAMQEGWAALDAARAANSACGSDFDCTIVWGDTSCGGDSLYPVSFAGRAGFEAAVDDIDQTICSQLGPECPLVAVDYFGLPQAMCVAGQCQLHLQAPEENEAVCNGSSERRESIEGCIDCDVAMQKSNVALNAVVAEYDACQVDSDCVHVSDDTGCVSTCGNAINAANVDAYEEARLGVVADYCTGGSCPIAMAGCMPQEPKCDAGRCTLVGTW